VQERNDEDSCGVLELEMSTAQSARTPVAFQVTGSATKSQRWFGIYEVR
jgi:hypothetical protein